MFGEIALIYGCKRTATVLSKNFSTCSGLNKEDFDEIIRFFPNIASKIKDLISKTYRDSLKDYFAVSQLYLILQYIILGCD